MADIVIDGACQSNLYATAARGGIFWTSPTVGYVVYADAAHDLQYNKTSNGGIDWDGAVTIKVGTIVAIDCWADWQTVGDSGTKIHIAYIDQGSQSVRYVYLDTDGDSVGGDDQIEAAQGTGQLKAVYGRPVHRISITKTRGGNLAVAFGYSDGDDVFFYEFYTSPDAAAWTNEATPWEAALDHILLFPGNEVDNQDIWALFWDESATSVSLKTYDDSGDSWSEQFFDLVTQSPTYLQMGGAIRFSDGHLICALWTAYDSAAADLVVWDINGAGSITQKTDVLTNSAESFLTSVFIDQSTDDIYVAYASTGTSIQLKVVVYYKKSDDGGANWGAQQSMQAGVEDDERWISCGAVKEAWGGMFLPVWFNDDINDLFCNNDNAVSIAAAAVAFQPWAIVI